MFQVGWASTSRTVARYMASFVHSRSAPPEQVSSRRLTGLPCRACRHWKMAECSLSTGSRGTPFSAAFLVTSSPPVTSASLLASSTRSHTSSACHTASSPAMPTMAQSASWHFEAMSAWTVESGPKNHWMPRRSSGISSGSFTSAATSGLNSRHSSNSLSDDPWAVRQPARKPSG